MRRGAAQELALELISLRAQSGKPLNSCQFIVFDAVRDTKWAKKTWAPCAIERDGKFFLYFGNGGGNIGVVVGDSPTGPFKDVVGKPLIEHGMPGVQPAKNMWLFDPGVFIDDDGQAYIYFGGNGDDNVRAAKLKKDMITLDGEVIKMNAPNLFEAAWVWKKDGKYYFSYSSTPKAEMRIDYMTGDSPLEFKYAGIAAAQSPFNNNNNHAVEFEFKGRWYHVYHNRIVATEAKGVHDLCLRFTGDEGPLMNVDYWKFQ